MTDKGCEGDFCVGGSGFDVKGNPADVSEEVKLLLRCVVLCCVVLCDDDGGDSFFSGSTSLDLDPVLSILAI
jgi:hypothetical protein